ncbi:TonB-dependent receptor [Emcibacter nanhaiensis]|uniref:TonB-dependent receptor n=1 Tax=Emcibacter nanhaiensis TaxID=1505037 RepID=A0A501PH93_9PROT|nr:TonB-dependent receptor [Emcibacter nanhaiensis]
MRTETKGNIRRNKNQLGKLGFWPGKYREPGVKEFGAVAGRNGRLSLRAATALALLMTVGVTGVNAPARADEGQTISMERQPLGEALQALARDHGVNIIYDAGIVANKTASTADLPASLEQALHQILAGSGLGFRRDEKGNVYVFPVTGPHDPAGDDERSSLKQMDSDPEKSLGKRQGLAEEAEAVLEFEEIVVTGSNIRGGRSASPVFKYDREDIDRLGVSSVPQFIQQLPQNFGGGIAENTSGLVTAEDGININEGTGINLRGLGNDATLVLIDGRRLAPVGMGNFVDISMIPLTAIDRVEVLTDGASAIYGSDAVGGVVNFKLRKDFDGAETRLRYGTATDGDLDEFQVGQVFGSAWETGHALASYEYYKRDHLDANDRDYSVEASDPTDLLPRQKRQSIFLNFGQEVADRGEIFADGYYTIRESTRLGTNTVTLNTEVIDRNTEQYGGSLGGRFGFLRDWQLELVGTISESQAYGGYLNENTRIYRDLTGRNSRTMTVDAKADGSLGTIPGGSVRMAVGGQFRHENFWDPEDEAVDEARDVKALFGEVFVPFVGEENSGAFGRRLELTLAARYEDYSDFGNTLDPKVGLLWQPVEGVALRGTFGTSFRAPLFSELDESSNAGYLLYLPNPAVPSGATLAVLTRGNNSRLQPETATSWTAGFDYTPAEVPGLSLKVTYFNISFNNRITAAKAYLDSFTNPRWASVIDYSPDPAYLEYLAGQPRSGNFTSSSEFTDAEALVDGNLRNMASIKTSGLDFQIAYAFDTGIGNFNWSLSGSWLLDFEEKLLETDEPVDQLDNYNYPVDLRLKSILSWAKDGLSANLSVNYTDGYTDRRSETEVPVKSWTTFDLNIGYETGDKLSAVGLQNTAFSLIVLNLFNQDPPYVTGNFGYNINYDPANASPMGRVISLQLTKKW